MLNLSTVPAPFLWAAGIIVVFPLTSVALGEVILRLRRRGHALAVPFANLRSVVLPALVVLVLMREVVGWDGRGTAVRLVETLLWLFIVHTALSFLNAILFAGAKEGSWQSKFPRLFIDLIRLLVVLMAAAVVLSTVWEQDLAKLVAALGVGTICVGLALQQPLGNLFSGIFLMIERPIAVGDWVKFDVHVGKVIETTWRAVHLRTRDQNLVVIPNGSLATGTFTNYSRPGRVVRRTVTLGFAYADPPNQVKRMLREVAVRTPGVLPSPAPKVQMLNEFANPNNVYEVRLMVADFEPSDDVVEEYRTLVWYAAERFGLHMTSATQVQMVGDQSPAPAPLSRHAIAAFPRFDLGREAAAGSGAGSAVKLYGRGEQVVAEGRPLAGIHLILDGTARLSVRDAADADVVIARLGRGEFFGEKSLVSGQVSDVTVTAADDLEVLVLDTDALHGVLERTPQLAREIGQVMESRRKAITGLRSGLPSA